MSPKISSKLIGSDEIEQKCEFFKINSINALVDDGRGMRDVEQGVEERGKRKFYPCDDEDDIQAIHSNSKKRRRVLTESDDSFSLLSSSSDDYGTDSELVEIDENKQRKTSCRCAVVNEFEDLENDSGNRIIICSENSFQKHPENYSVSKSHPIKNITSTMRVDEIINKITTISKINNSNASTRCLLDVAIATLKLVKKNREFQLRLTELQSDTTNLLNSVLENPENHLMKERLKFSVL